MNKFPLGSLVVLILSVVAVALLWPRPARAGNFRFTGVRREQIEGANLGYETGVRAICDHDTGNQFIVVNDDKSGAIAVAADGTCK